MSDNEYLQHPSRPQAQSYKEKNQTDTLNMMLSSWFDFYDRILKCRIFFHILCIIRMKYVPQIVLYFKTVTNNYLTDRLKYLVHIKSKQSVLNQA
jgi:hypothetical protein